MQKIWNLVGKTMPARSISYSVLILFNDIFTYKWHEQVTVSNAKEQLLFDLE